jgi:purine nucleoside phosphorylase
MSKLLDMINDTLKTIQEKTNKTYQIGIVLGTGLEV